MRSVQDYTSLITPWNGTKVSLVDTVATTVEPFADLQAFFNTVPAAFDIDEAIGAQLDAVGKWVGLDRSVKIPLPNTFFSWGIAGQGWGQGYWKGPFDPDTGVTQLDDETYRIMLRSKIRANNWDGTTTSANEILADVFGGNGTYVWIEDHQDMSATFMISGTIPSAVILALITQFYIPLQSVTVRYKLAMTSVSGRPVFGWGQDDQYIGGWGNGAWAVSDTSLIIYP